MSDYCAASPIYVVLQTWSYGGGHGEGAYEHGQNVFGYWINEADAHKFIQERKKLKEWGAEYKVLSFILMGPYYDT